MNPATIAYIIMAIGAALQYKANKTAQKKTRRAIDDAEDRQDDLSKRNRKQVLGLMEQYDPEKRQENKDLAANTASEGLISEVIAAKENGGGNIDATQGRVSNAYDTDFAKAQNTRIKKASNIAKLMGKIRAPGDLRFEEGLANSDSQSKSAIIGSLMKSRWTTDQGRINMAKIPNAEMMLAGDLMKSYGGYKAMGAGSAGSDGGASNVGAGGANKFMSADSFAGMKPLGS